MTAHLVRALDPQGGQAFLCYKAPRLTPHREEATRFTNAQARYAAHAAREARKGWTFTVEKAR